MIQTNTDILNSMNFNEIASSSRMYMTESGEIKRYLRMTLEADGRIKEFSKEILGSGMSCHVYLKTPPGKKHYELELLDRKSKLSPEIKEIVEAAFKNFNEAQKANAKK